MAKTFSKMELALSIDADVVDDRTLQLIKQYWDAWRSNGATIRYSKTVRQLCTEFGLRQRELIEIIGDWSCVVLGKCSKCSDEVYVQSRSDLAFGLTATARGSLICESCRDAEDEALREAKKAEERTLAEAAANKAERRAIIIEKHFPDSLPAAEPQSLTLEDAVFLSSIWRAAMSECLDELPAMGSVSERIAPTEEMSVEILRHLTARHIIQVHPESPEDAFVFEGDTILHYYLFKVRWLIAPAMKDESLIARIEDIFHKDSWSPGWENEVLQLWRRIALHECYDYLKVQMKQHGFDFTPGDKTRIVFLDALTTFSTAQMYSFIYRAVRDAAALYVREGISRNHAANTAIGSIRRSVERARTDEWTVPNYRPDFRCPQSAISKVLFDAALKIGARGFNEIPAWPKQTALANAV